MRVIFAEAAILDLERIGEYYLRIEPETAAEKVLNIRKACERLAAFPRSGRFIRGIDLRRAVFGPFLIFLPGEGRCCWNCAGPSWLAGLALYSSK